MIRAFLRRIKRFFLRHAGIANLTQSHANTQAEVGSLAYAVGELKTLLSEVQGTHKQATDSLAEIQDALPGIKVTLQEQASVQATLAREVATQAMLADQVAAQVRLAEEVAAQARFAGQLSVEMAKLGEQTRYLQESLARIVADDIKPLLGEHSVLLRQLLEQAMCLSACQHRFVEEQAINRLELDKRLGNMHSELVHVESFYQILSRIETICKRAAAESAASKWKARDNGRLPQIAGATSEHNGNGKSHLGTSVAVPEADVVETNGHADLIQAIPVLPKGLPTGVLSELGAPAGRAFRRFEHGEGIDLVDCGDFRLFMLREDNLYNISVPQARKRYSLAKHYQDIRENGYARAPVDARTVATVRDACFGIYKVLYHFYRTCVDFRFLDVGAFVGDVSVRYANFFRTLGCEKKFYCFDPTLSGDLIPFNVQLNGLENCITHYPLAVSPVDGFITFAQRRGHSDSNRATLEGEEQQNSIIPSIKLSRFIDLNGIGNAFIKLDTENLESVILQDIAGFLQSTMNVVCFECHAHDLALRGTIEDLFATHLLYDVGYVPRPFCFSEIDPRDLGNFYERVQNRPYGYTDICAISRRLPALERLQQELTGLTEAPVEYSLVY